MPEATPAKKSPFLTTIIIAALVLVAIFIVAFFLQLNSTKPQFTSQEQPVAEATNSADFNQAERLEATGASLSTGETEAMHILYGRTDCSHCRALDQFLAANPNLAAQVTKKLLDDPQLSQQHRQELTARAKICGLNSNTIGVPFLYVNDEQVEPQYRCLMGDQPIQTYLSTLTN